MKTLLFSIISIFLLSSSGIKDLRDLFQNASQNEKNALLFNEMTQKDLGIEKNLLLAYEGASETLLAKFGSSPAEKLKLFKSGKEKIENAVAAEPSNIEIKLIRLIIQNNAPAMLRYSNNIAEDKSFILSNFKNADADVKEYILKVGKESGIFSQEELNTIN